MYMINNQLIHKEARRLPFGLQRQHNPDETYWNGKSIQDDLHILSHMSTVSLQLPLFHIVYQTPYRCSYWQGVYLASNVLSGLPKLRLTLHVQSDSPLLCLTLQLQLGLAGLRLTLKVRSGSPVLCLLQKMRQTGIGYVLRHVCIIDVFLTWIVAVVTK